MDLFCPSCKAEYRPGFTECSDCGVGLVYELSEEQPPREKSRTVNHAPEADLVAIYSTYNPADVMMIKSLLDAEGIVHNFQGEMFKASGVFMAPAMLFVPRQDTQRVVDLIRDHGLE
jgi:hypothetical protein